MGILFLSLVGLAGLLLLYSGGVLHPQIREIKRKMALLEFQGTAHYKTMEFSLKGLQGRLSRLHRLIALLVFLVALTALGL